MIYPEINLKDLLSQKYELEQSISYARFIQKALLPAVDDLKNSIQDSFVLYEPRDVVSGDFYWFNRQSDKLILAVGDCTGHGVPGAFLSILGISFLNLVVSKYNPNNPDVLLNYLREYVMKALNQSGEFKEQRDGIDLSVCMLYKRDNLLCYSGSFNPLYIVRNKNLIQLEGNKIPLGISVEMEYSFTARECYLQSNDMIYLFSNGFPDQFGGPDGKKYKYPAFRKLLINCSDLPIEEQKKILKSELIEWRGKLPQLDDITILGFRV